MKIDLGHVGREIVMCMSITYHGAEKLAKLMQPGTRMPVHSTILEILFEVENASIRVEDAGITSWVVAIQGFRKEMNYREIPAEDIQAALLYLVGNDLIGVTMVVL